MDYQQQELANQQAYAQNMDKQKQALAAALGANARASNNGTAAGALNSVLSGALQGYMMKQGMKPQGAQVSAIPEPQIQAQNLPPLA